MNVKKLLVDFATVFAVSLIVSVVVSVLWNLIVHGTTTIDWETSFRFAILFGIILLWIETRRSRRKSNTE
jgi:hypothetical protein